MQAARPRTIAKMHPQMWYFLWGPLSLQVLLYNSAIDCYRPYKRITLSSLSFYARWLKYIPQLWHYYGNHEVCKSYMKAVTINGEYRISKKTGVECRIVY